MQANGLSVEFAEQVFQQIRGFGEYGFPESHAASFALLVYVSAWLKRHYPAAFCGRIINSQPMGFYAPAQLVRDAREHGVEVRPIDVNFSAWDCSLEAVSACELPASSRLPLAFAVRLGIAVAERVVATSRRSDCRRSGRWTVSFLARFRPPHRLAPAGASTIGKGPGPRFAPARSPPWIMASLGGNGRPGASLVCRH